MSWRSGQLSSSSRQTSYYGRWNPEDSELCQGPAQVKVPRTALGAKKQFQLLQPLAEASRPSEPPLCCSGSQGPTVKPQEREGAMTVLIISSSSQQTETQAFTWVHAGTGRAGSAGFQASLAPELGCRTPRKSPNAPDLRGHREAARLGTSPGKPRQSPPPGPPSCWCHQAPRPRRVSPSRDPGSWARPRPTGQRHLLHLKRKEDQIQDSAPCGPSGTNCPQDKLPPGPPRPGIKRTANLSFAGLRTGPPRSPPAQNERADSPWTHEATAPRGEKGRLIPPALGEDDSLGGSQGSECYPGRKLRTALRKLHVDSTQSPGWKREGHSQSCFAGAVSLPTALKEPLGKAATSGLWGPKEAKWQSGVAGPQLASWLCLEGAGLVLVRETGSRSAVPVPG
nr:translation initiation factor IF-2-like [Symphalangus syndactylus]